MDVARIIRDPISRRRFFGRAGVTFVGGSAVFLSACGESQDQKDEENEPSSPEADIDILNDALALELTAVEAYTKGAPLLTGAVLGAGEAFLAHEEEHAAALEQAIVDLGGKATAVKQELDYSALQTQEDVLEFANNLENVAISAYVDSIPKLSSGPLRATASQIVTNEAEHVSVLLAALGVPAVPSAFVAGNPEALG